METITYQNEIIHYEIVKRGTKNLYARMDDDNVVKLSIPYFVKKSIIEDFVITSYHKLLKKRRDRNKIVNDGKIKILGDVCELDQIDNLDYQLTMILKKYLQDNYINICKNIGVMNPPKVVLKRVKGYLGQYNKKQNKITLNILIGHLDSECIEYILIHELTHIKYMNHQKEFWDSIEVYLPNYKKIRNKCKKEFVYYENY